MPDEPEGCAFLTPDEPEDRVFTGETRSLVRIGRWRLIEGRLPDFVLISRTGVATIVKN